MRRNGQRTGREAPARPAGATGDHRRTTLSFLAATFAVAASASLGLNQAAVAATAPASVPMSAGPSSTAGSLLEPAPPNTAPDSTAAVATDHLPAALERLRRWSGTVDESTLASDPSPTTAPTTISPSIGTAPGTVEPTERSPRSTTKATEPAPMAIRQWRPVSNASFRRFVEKRDFTTVEYLTPGFVHGTIVESDQRVNVVLVHRSATAPMRVSPSHRDREPVGEWARAIGATAGINANWYDPFDGPAVSAGRVYGGSDHGYTALFGFTADGDLVADHHNKIHRRVDPRIVEAVSGHPTLIHRGEPTTEFGGDPTFTARHPRSAIGVSASVDVLILVTVDGRRADAAGMTGLETAALLERLGAHDAVMLDGGGSSALWIAGRGIVNRQSDPGRAVGNQIAVFGR